MINVAKNTDSGYRRGAVRDRAQFQGPNGWLKRDAKSGQIQARSGTANQMIGRLGGSQGNKGIGQIR